MSHSPWYRMTSCRQKYATKTMTRGAIQRRINALMDTVSEAANAECVL